MNKCRFIQTVLSTVQYLGSKGKVCGGERLKLEGKRDTEVVVNMAGREVRLQQTSPYMPY